MAAAAQSGGDGQPPLVLLLLKGHPGSGKSSLGRELARQTGWCVADKDDCKDELVAALAPGVPDSALNPVSYQVMFRVAATQLALGHSVIADCPLSRRGLYDQAVGIAAQHGAAVVVAECLPSDDAAWRRRLEARAKFEHGTAATHKPQSWGQLLGIIQRYGGEDRWVAGAAVPYHLEVDTTADGVQPREHAASVVQFLASRGLLTPASVTAAVGTGAAPAAAAATATLGIVSW